MNLKVECDGRRITIRDMNRNKVLVVAENMTQAANLLRTSMDTTRLAYAENDRLRAEIQRLQQNLPTSERLPECKSGEEDE